ncbi:hypothetical protein Dsin_018135 [Dipteronia sinensis]|uniref:RNase H type-1 domain-containing protein n=1 Tax=Dipteronia sinensis TaxID=43782 RepID=A0AAE0AGE9_9ROSI|nr:hypothetical protein Dsin_018135 [Dipteronia sinensis]
MGLGTVNHQGFDMAAGTQRMQAGYSSQVVEAVAVLHGITFAVDTCQLPFVVESDTLGVVKMINEGRPSPGRYWTDCW